ncbi:hypothetical protein [Kineococcus rhizosphaerae]|uniref:Uncharacterized protein n=1 Tax=Kineococcus rhizosphaerae TaxID=559628 RepID=A0A2T0R219_9ACTN|nr:hypothetical protein [Kineococcus rhizosphaerae]PRY13596.1 hypothetical protein CLV37_108266 [Kineococcus rhizosphaerae]
MNFDPDAHDGALYVALIHDVERLDDDLAVGWAIDARGRRRPWVLDLRPGFRRVVIPEHPTDPPPAHEQRPPDDPYRQIKELHDVTTTTTGGDDHEAPRDRRAAIAYLLEHAEEHPDARLPSTEVAVTPDSVEAVVRTLTMFATAEAESFGLGVAEHVALRDLAEAGVRYRNQLDRCVSAFASDDPEVAGRAREYLDLARVQLVAAAENLTTTLQNLEAAKEADR